MRPLDKGTGVSWTRNAAKVLLVGGAGYIGSHLTRELIGDGYSVVVLDNLSRGHRDAVSPRAEFVPGDIRCRATLERLLVAGRFDAVLHLAALAYVSESFERPEEYRHNNVVGTRNLLDAAAAAGIRRVVFTSSCAVYGIPSRLPIPEGHPCVPVSPYGRTKRAAEEMLADFASNRGIDSVALRLFNVAGCGEDGELPERHEPETHLIPNVLEEARRVLDGGRPEQSNLVLFGSDFDTQDGTAVRDYIHVSDVCRAHLAALRRLLAGAAFGAEVYNAGSGRGTSARQIVLSARRVTGADIRYRTGPRRSGDPPAVFSDSQKAAGALGWKPRYGESEEIVRSAWRGFPGSRDA